MADDRDVGAEQLGAEISPRQYPRKTFSKGSKVILLFFNLY